MAKVSKAPKSGDERKALIAKKDWHIISGSWDKATNKSEVDRKIKVGDDVSDLPAHLLAALRTENVI